MTNSSGAFTVAANPSLSLAGRTAVVTGASSGIGAADGRRGGRGAAVQAPGGAVRSASSRATSRFGATVR
ncbi:hypothetical protein GCM10010420_52170 [Streptomyces glaucosporus]|uniref:Uncharacterized protein n=1 Tax=Streptomyces glaucosporus TaxID=284044 RepID=A0ABP5W1C8_9ACTN